MAFISLQSLSVDFPIYNLNARSFKKQLLSFSTGGIIKDKDRGCIVVRALDQLTFEINHGDRVALLGHNGAGKSTLLRVLAKIYEPSSGAIRFDGHIYPLFDLTLGFNQESTGYENIVLRGLLLGLSRTEIMSKIDKIIEFSELGNYIKLPIRTYSSGMQLRLAFSVTVHINPDILLLDEMIGTGDASFKKKAKEKLDELLQSANIVVIASHDDELIKKFCNRAILFENGKVKYNGNVEEALDIYHNRKDLKPISNIIGIANSLQTEESLNS